MSKIPLIGTDGEQPCLFGVGLGGGEYDGPKLKRVAALSSGAVRRPEASGAASEWMSMLSGLSQSATARGAERKRCLLVPLFLLAGVVIRAMAARSSPSVETTTDLTRLQQQAILPIEGVSVSRAGVLGWLTQCCHGWSHSRSQVDQCCRRSNISWLAGIL